MAAEIIDVDTIHQISMKIILYSGKARNFNMKALDAILLDDYVSARKHINLAKEKINEAHKEQTRVIQYSAENELPFDILFNHAQDTLMTIMSEINISEKLIEIAYHLDNKKGIEK